MPSDAEFVELARRGDLDAFGVLYDRYARLVRAVCADSTRELNAAQDLAQEVFPRAFERLSELRDATSFGAWVVGIARFAGKEWRRRQARDRHRFATDLEEETDRPADVADDRVATLLALLADLPDMERQALHAFYLEEQSASRGAAALGLSRSGFYKLLSSARRRLAQRFRQTQEDQQ